MKKIIFALTLICFLMLSVCAYANMVTQELRTSIIRLHIIAQSNSDYDQQIKLSVRDEVLAATKNINIEDTETFLYEAEKAANLYLLQNKIPYLADAEFGTFYFPEKNYRNITLPSGEYQGVRIVLGKGEGENWWCVMYPPLCVSEKMNEAEIELKNSLSDDTYEIITKKPQIRFKLLELIK